MNKSTTPTCTRRRAASASRALSGCAGIARIFPLALIALCAGMAGMLLALQTNSPESAADSTALDSVQAKLGNSLILPADFKQVPEFTLLDKDATEVSADLLRGQWNLVFFGFTQCPDVCPLTLSTLADAVKKIKSGDASLPEPAVVFVSVDPKRDTVDVIKNYVEFFNPEFQALTGTLNQIHQLTNPLNIVVAYTANDEDENNYTVDHTAAILLVDPELRVRAQFNAPHMANEIAADYQTILQHIIN